MSFSKINNNFNIANLQKTQSSISQRSFKAAANVEDNTGSNDNRHVFGRNKLSDNDIYKLSSSMPDERLSKVAKNMAKTLFLTIPVLDTIASAAVKKGNLSAKLKRGIVNAGRWASVFAAGASVAGVKSVVYSKSKMLDDFDRKHPVVSTIVDFSAIYTAFNFVNKGFKTVSASFKELFPSFTNNVKNNFYTPLKNIVNNSFINKKLVIPVENFVNKRPYLGRANKFSAMMLVPAMVMASFVRYEKEIKHRNITVDNNIGLRKAVNDIMPDSDNIQDF